MGLIGTWINGLVVDHFTASLNRKKRVCVVSDDYEQIRRFIIDDLHRGCSLYPMKGGYHEEDHVEIQTLLASDEFASLLNFLKVNQINHFLTAGNVSEIYGKWNADGHKMKRHPKKPLPPKA